MSDDIDLDLDDEWRMESETLRGHMEVLSVRLQMLRNQLSKPLQRLLDRLTGRGPNE